MDRVFGGRFRSTLLLREREGVATLLGTDLMQGSDVVIKTVPSSHVSGGTQLRLAHEARILNEVRCPFLAPLLHHGSQEGLLYFVTPFVSGTTLEERLRTGPLSVRETLTVGRFICVALQEAHGRGVLHRDIKPTNVIIDRNPPLNRAVLIDFAFIRSARGEASMRKQPVSVVQYMSPEQAGLLDYDVGERSDLYSVGALLFECLAGRPPFEGQCAAEILRQHLTARPPELRTLGVQVPLVLNMVLQRLLRKDPRDRYQSAGALLADLIEISDALERGVAEPTLILGLHDRYRVLKEPIFVGRKAEISTLDRELGNARRGRGGLVIIESESGGGKTRLLEEMAHRGARNGFWVLRGQGVDKTAQRPFQVLDGVVREIVAEASLQQGFADRLKEILADERDALCAALPGLAEVLSPGSLSCPAGTGPEAHREARNLRALAAMLATVGSEGQPALVLLDDCQWADEMTLKFMKYWQRLQSQGDEQKRNILLVVSFRSENLPDNHPFRTIRASVHISLPPLEEDDVRRLAESMAGPLPEEAVRIICSLSEGSPFMAAEVLRGLMETGGIAAGPSGWVVAPEAMGDIQSSRHAAQVLARRLDLLKDNTLVLLSAGAVLGKEFDLDSAAALARQSSYEAISALNEARQRHIVWADAEGARCVFVHDKLRETLLARLPNDYQKALHLLAALSIEARDRDRVFELAYHFDAAGEYGRARSYALEAAVRARSQFALEIAERQYRIAEKGARAEDCPRNVRFRIATGLGEVLVLRGRYEEARSHFERAAPLASGKVEQAGTEGRLGELALKRGEVRKATQILENALRILGHSTPGNSLSVVLLLVWEILTRGLRILIPPFLPASRKSDEAGAGRLAIRLYGRLMFAYYSSRGAKEAIWASLRMINMAERFPPGREIGQAYSVHGLAMCLVPLFKLGIANVEKGLALHKKTGDLWGQGQSLSHYGIILHFASKFSQGVERLTEAVDLLDRTGDRWEANTARNHRARCLYRLGDLARAVEESQKVYHAALELGEIRTASNALEVWAKAAAGRIPPEMTQELLERSAGDNQAQRAVLQAEGVRLLTEGEPEKAARSFEGALRTAKNANEYNAPIFAWMATALREEMERTSPLAPKRRKALFREARNVAGKALRIARQYQNNLPHALRESALLAAGDGKEGEAVRLFDEGLSAAARQGARYEHALTLGARGQVGLALGWPGAREDIAAARGVLFALGIDFERGEKDLHGAPLEPQTLSRPFSALLEAGRKIAGALSREAVMNAVVDAATALLPVDRVHLLETSPGAESAEREPLPCEVSGECDQGIVRRALSTCRPASTSLSPYGGNSDGLPLCGVRSALCAPISFRGRPDTCFYVTHRDVGGAFGKDEEGIAEFIAAIAGAALENAEGVETIADSLSLARLVQERLLQPSSLQVSMDPGPLTATVDTFNAPSMEVGGDFYRVFPVGESKLFVVIGDVIGRGVASALVMAMTLALFEEAIRRQPAPAQVLKWVNSRIHASLNGSLNAFVTALALLVDSKERTYRLARAGHERAFLLRGNRCLETPGPGGLPLGVFPAETYEEVSLPLKRGDRFLLYTDGLIEMERESESPLSRRFLRRLLEHLPAGGAKDLNGAVANVFSRSGARTRDDVTFLSLGLE
ncbi:MAG: SpoIIE family protein phosphatase [Armatimonadetes bacterium]|nr:SpoIIE family protein phosphatase [Armatimonadota bacterium]